MSHRFRHKKEKIANCRSNSGMENFEIELYRENNLFQKRLFRDYLLRAISAGNEELFKKVVEFIGTQWGVRRTISNKKISSEEEKEISEIESNFDKFAKHLWDNKEKILNGTFVINALSLNANSYESKICFLLNPCFYKIIFDSHNRKAIGNKDCEYSKWQKEVDVYYEKTFGKNTYTIEEYFLNDCNLWLKGMD